MSIDIRVLTGLNLPRKGVATVLQSGSAGDRCFLSNPHRTEAGMSLRTCICVLVFVAFNSFTVGTSGAQSLELVGKLASALTEAKDAFENLTVLRAAAADALAGKNVSTGGDWSALADQYDRAAQLAREAPLPSQFQSRNIVSVADLANCSTRSNTIEKLRAYRDELASARGQGSASVARLDESLSEISRAQEALAYLIDVHGKLSTLPIYGQRFAFDWVDLEARVRPALNGLEGDLRRQRSRFVEDLSKLNLSISNFQANLDQMTKMRGCDSEASLDQRIMGVWRGPYRHRLYKTQISSDGQTLAGTFTMTITQKLGPAEYSGKMVQDLTRTASPGRLFADGTKTESFQEVIPVTVLILDGRVKIKQSNFIASSEDKSSTASCNSSSADLLVESWQFSGRTISASGEVTSGCPGVFNASLTKE